MPLSRFITKTVPFNFRGKSLTFDLSQGLFSSAGIDTGTKFLLKVFSRILDEDAAAGKSPPRLILDCGCGCGVIGICAAAALAAAGAAEPPQVRCQDRDELARLFTLHNAAKNGIPPAALEAYTEPLLAGPESAGAPVQWDMILTNIPAKAGTPVLADFVSRSAALLKPGGKVIMVAVHTLADFFREQIAAEAELLREEHGSGHNVFVYGGRPSADKPQTAEPLQTKDFVTRHQFYARTAVTCPIENIPIRLETIHGASGFDSPRGAVLAAAKLTTSHQLFGGAGNIDIDGAAADNGGSAILVHEPEQGFFPCWLLEFLKNNAKAPQTVILSGRNILALEASAHNVQRNVGRHAAPPAVPYEVRIVPAADIPLAQASLLKALEAAGGRQYQCIAAFPELLPQSLLPKDADQLACLWAALPPLLAKEGIFIAAFGSSDAERFDRKKPAGFTRLGSVKKNGFRALGYKFS